MANKIIKIDGDDHESLEVEIFMSGCCLTIDDVAYGKHAGAILLPDTRRKLAAALLDGLEDEKPNWIERSAWVAAKIATDLVKLHPDLRAERDPEGKSLGHLLHMAEAIRDGKCGIDSDTKACRWLGWLQACLAYEGIKSLEDSKSLNLASANCGTRS